MKYDNYILFPIGLMLVGCAESYRVQDADIFDGASRGDDKHAEHTEAYAAAKAYYDSITQKDVWSTCPDFESMKKACQLPDDILSKASTQDLADICSIHPLLGTYGAYDNALRGAAAVLDDYNVYQELISREDAGGAILNTYEGIDIIFTVSDYSSEKITDPAGFSRMKNDFFELMIAKGDVPALFDLPCLDRLKEIHNQKLDTKSLHPEEFSYESAKTSYLVEARMKERNGSATPEDRKYLESGGQKNASDGHNSEGPGNSRSIYTITGYAYLSTKCGRSVEGRYHEELTASEIASINAYVDQIYTEATRLSEPTSTYNCHSYAWNMTDGGTACWIEPLTDSGAANVSLYYTHDYYMTTSESNATKVVYGSLDHSAVISSVSGMYESKWGSWPLMRHKLDYPPYEHTYTYYKPCYYMGALSTSYGTGTTTVGSQDTYFVSSSDLNSTNYPTGPNVTGTWILETAKGDTVDSTTADYTIAGANIIITFKKAGMYTLSYELSLNGKAIGYFAFDPIVEL